MSGGQTRRLGAVALAALATLPALRGTAWSADLSRGRIVRAPPDARVYTTPPALPDPDPASTNGYYGYYGYDIQGVPYYGLYSEDVTCLRSAVTPRGYRVVDVCRPD